MFSSVPETGDREVSHPADEGEGVLMSLMDKLADGAERAAREAEKAFDKGKTKVGELQVEMQMDGLARKLGYLVFDFYRGRQVDQAVRQKILDELSRLEDQLLKTRAQAAAKAESDAAAGAAAGGPASGPASGPADAPTAGEAAANTAAADTGSTTDTASTAEAAPTAGSAPTAEAAPTDGPISAAGDSPSTS